MHTVHVAAMPVARCETCGAISEGIDSERAFDSAMREQLGLLTTDEIRLARSTLALTQQQLAEAVGCAAESLSRWETGGMVQSRVYDTMLRAYFGLPEFREFAGALGEDKTLGRSVVVRNAPTYLFSRYSKGPRLAPLPVDRGNQWNGLIKPGDAGQYIGTGGAALGGGAAMADLHAAAPPGKGLAA